jgi:outer membrane protein
VKTLIAIGVLSSFALASAAYAQAPAAPAAAQPVIPGVCTYWSEKVVATSSAGKQMTDRMKQLLAQVQAELQSDEASLAAEQKRLEALPADQQKAQVPAFQDRINAYQQKKQQRAQELQQTQTDAIKKIGVVLDPILNQIYVEKGCGILFDRNQYLGANPAMDVSDIAIQRLNAKMPNMPPFERSSLNQQPVAVSAAPPAAPAPVAPRKKK